LVRSENREKQTNTVEETSFFFFFGKRELNQSVKKDKDSELLRILLKREEQNKDSKKAKKKKEEISLTVFILSISLYKIYKIKLTDCDMILSKTIWDVSEEAKEKGFPETVAQPSSNSPMISSCIIPPAPHGMVLLEKTICGAKTFDTSKADTLHERERNSMGSRGVSGGRKRTGSGRHSSVTGLSIGERRGWTCVQCRGVGGVFSGGSY
jgi:hypothetical protein